MEGARIEVHPATPERFDDVAVVLAPRTPGAPACWCLSMRIPNAENQALHGDARAARLRRYAEEGAPPGVVAYVDGEPAGWCSIGPRSSHHRLTHSRTIPTVDDVPVWSIVCLVVRPGFRRQGLSRHLLDGAVGFARSAGAPMVEAYPVDAGGRRLSSAFAYMGTMSLFESAGFVPVAETTATVSGAPRRLVRLDLRSSRT